MTTGGVEVGAGAHAHIPLFVNTKSISCLAKLSLTVFLLGERGSSVSHWRQDKHGGAARTAQTVNLPSRPRACVREHLKSCQLSRTILSSSPRLPRAFNWQSPVLLSTVG